MALPFRVAKSLQSSDQESPAVTCTMVLTKMESRRKNTWIGDNFGEKPFEISLHTMNLNLAKTSHSSTWCRAHSGGGDASPHRQQRNLWGFQLKEDHPRAFRVVFFYHS